MLGRGENMVSPNPDQLRQGILVEHNQTFYYIDSGVSSRHNNLERLRRILVTRQVLDLQDSKKNEWKILTLQKAKQLKTIEIVPVYTTPMMKFLAEQEPTPVKNLWQK